MRGKMGRNRVAAALLLGGVAAFFMACEKDVLPGVNENIKINFSLGDSSYGESETVRGSGEPKAEPETVVIPVEGALRIYATLEEEEEQLRVLETIVPGTKVRIVAFNSGNAWVDDVEYTVGAGGSITGDSEMQLPAEGDYTFVAYSLNTNGTTPAYSASPVGLFSANNDDDPLCGSLTTHVIEGDNNLTIKMYHQFSKVKVNATTAGMSGTPLIGPITTVLPGYKAKLDILGAGLVKDVVEDQEIGWPTFSPAVNVTSNERKVYAGGEASTYIRIPSVTLGGVLYEGLTPARFVKELEPGKRYTLTLAFKNLQFAGSNIYWKAVASGPQAPGYLTFDGVGETAHQMYQGVFFMWGSLVGISPAGDHGVAVNSTSKIYVPTFNSGSNPTWATDDDLLANVPFVKDIFPGDFLDPSGTYLMDNDRNTSTCWNDKKGDICRYISENGYGPGGNYRLPTGYELGTPMGITTYIVLDYGTSGWTRIGTTWAGSGNYTSVPSTYGDGTFLISCGASNNGFVFPASGNKLATTTNNGGGDSYLSNVNGSGFYWSGTARGTFDPPYFPVTYYMAYIISISYANVYIQGDPYWILGQSDVPVYPVRCIKY